MKRSFLFIITFFTIVKICPAQQSSNILDWKSHVTLYDYVIHILHAQYIHRDSVLKEAIQHHAIPAYQQYCKKNYFKILGTFPKKTPLHPEVTGTIQREGYQIKKVLYQSFPNHYVTANLYVPDGKGPFPGVLFFCGHEATAKATITYQQTCILFAKHGFVVLSIDPISQGERYQLTDSLGKPLTRGGTTGHTLLASGANIVGTSVVAYQIWDNERGLDYLCSLKNVDTSRLGCLGNSGGGTQTAYFIPYDPRIKVAAICSYTTRRERTLELLGPQDGCQWLPDEGQAGLDISDYIIMLAPKPLLILAGRYDFVDYNGVKDVYRELKNVYGKLNHPEKVKLFAYDDGHGIQKPKQEVAVQWLRRWLYHDNKPITEPPLPTLKEKQLNVTKSGQVNKTFKNENNIQDRDLTLAKSWSENRHKLLQASSRQAYRAMLRKVLRIQPQKHTIDTQRMGLFTKDHYHFQKIILRTSGKPPLPCLLAYGKPGKKLKIILNGNGKAATLQNDSLINDYYNKGYSVLLADLRGIGETSDEPDKNASKYYNQEYRNAMLSLFTGQSLPAQRTEDIFTLLAYCRTDKYLKSLPVEIKASGPAAEAALFAVALDDSITKVTLSHTLHSFIYLLQHPLMKNQYSYVVPDALYYFDLPDIAQFAGRDKVYFIK